MSKTTDAFVEQNRDRLLDELKEFLRIPSISTLPEHRGDIDRAAQFVADSLRHVGMENVEIIPTAKHPLVYADWMHAPGKPTVLCYGHYDVQPADPLEEWKSPPFEPDRARRQHLRTRHGRRQRPDVHARERPSKRCAPSTARCPST
jgi:acetylornithine deacetylase/succinyl-diaminopimelate desuccinylase-like protein